MEQGRRVQWPCLSVAGRQSDKLQSGMHMQDDAMEWRRTFVSELAIFLRHIEQLGSD